MPVRKVKDRLYITDEIQYEKISDLIDYLSEKRKLYPDAYIEIESEYERDYGNGYDDNIVTSAHVVLIFERDETSEERRRRINEKRAANKRRRDNAKREEETAKRIAKEIQERERAELLALANKIGAKVTF